MSAARLLPALTLGLLAVVGCTADPTTNSMSSPPPAESLTPAPAVTPAVVHGDLTADTLFLANMDRIDAAAAEPAAAQEVESAAEAEAEPSNHCDDPDWWNARQSGDPGDYEAACGEYPYWLEEPTDDYYLDPDAIPGENCLAHECTNGLSAEEDAANEQAQYESQRQYACDTGVLPPEEC